MIDIQVWQAANNEYLSTALRWLRILLGRVRHTDRVDASADQELRAATASMTEAEANDPPPAIIILSRLLGLSSFERRVLLLCTAAELDTRIGPLCADAQDDARRSFPTFGLALSVFDDATWDALSPQRPLRYWRLLEIHQVPGQPLTSAALNADERIVNYVKGLNLFDDRLSPYVLPPDADEDPGLLAPSQEQLAALIRQHLERSDAAALPAIQLMGSDALSKRLVARRVCGLLGHSLYRLSPELLPVAPSDLESIGRLWQRESMLLPLALFVERTASDAGGLGEGRGSWIGRWLQRHRGIIFIDCGQTKSEVYGAASLGFDVHKPTRSEQQVAWTRALGSQKGRACSTLAATFDMNVPVIAAIARRAQAEVNGADGGVAEHAWQGCLAAVRPSMEALAQRLTPKAAWGDLVLSDDSLRALHKIGAQVRERMQVYEDWGFADRMSRGLGTSVLFAGESGTGKTMAAEVLAGDLEVNLYRVDLSAVVSKYIGETEKNLRRIFDAAEDGGSLLLFDEADALFGKRSEVKDSHDRYANIEINYLLQRMEEYRGLAILATNMKSALDQAFFRRLRYVVRFPFPAQQYRRLIWERAFPTRTPTLALDFDRLAALCLTGGSIQNIALNAAFLAASADGPVTMERIFEAAVDEFAKLERPFNDKELRVPARQEVVA